MFDVKQRLTLSNIYSKISENEIIQTIIPNASNNFFSIRKEKNKSAALTQYNGKIYIKDFGDPTQHKAETWYNYLSRINGWGKEGYILSLDWANRQFNLGLEELDRRALNSFSKKEVCNTTNVSSSFYEPKNPVKIEVRRGKWSKEDTNYWLQFGITTEMLEAKKIAPLDYFWKTNPNTDNIRRFFKVKDDLCYVYPYYRDDYGNFMYKIYSPLNEKYKWLSNVTSKVVENLRFIKQPKENLIIQSSFKDIIVMEYYRDNYGIFKDYDFVSPISEGIWFNGSWNKLKETYNTIIYYGNNDYDKPDNPGVAYANKWSNEFNIPFIVNYNWCKASDISDYRKDNREDKTKELLIKLEKYVEWII